MGGDYSKISSRARLTYEDVTSEDALLNGSLKTAQMPNWVTWGNPLWFWLIVFLSSVLPKEG